MIPVKIVALVILLYFALLFAVGYYGDWRRKVGRSIISNPTVYALSLAVYISSWTYYANVGRAATVGLDILPPYLGPSLLALTWWFLLRKMVRVSKEQNIVTMADFVSSRYGKSVALGAMVTVFALFGTMPYLALELRAVAHALDFLSTPLFGSSTVTEELFPFLPDFIDTAFILALFTAVFGVLFGARHLDASERHEGMVAAIALESVVKLVAFVAVGLFVCYGLFDGIGDIFTRFLAEFPEREGLLRLGTGRTSYAQWFSMTVISMMACMFLPRMFHILVIENSSEDHIRTAMWAFPAYLFLISLFILPIALGGLLLNAGYTFNAEKFVIYLPQLTSHPWLALFVFIGGFSASAAMIMLSSVALSTMILNNLLMPAILRFKSADSNIAGLLLGLKRLGIFAAIFLGYLYYRIIGETIALVDVGLISFVAVTQFAPAIIGGLYWKRANLKGAALGLAFGFLLWVYTLVVPSLVRAGWLSQDLLEKGPLGLGLLRPTELFGLTGLDLWSHSLFWTLLFNLGTFLIFSLFTTAGENEREQAVKFVDVFRPQPPRPERQRISRAPTILEFTELMSKFIGERAAHTAIAQYVGERSIDARGSLEEAEIPDLKRFTERTLAGSVGAAPAHIIVENYLAARGSEMEDVFDIFGSVTISRKAGREQLGVLHETTRLVARGGDLQTIFDNILELFRQQFGLDLCVLRILDEQRGVLTVRSQQGMSSGHLGESDRELDERTYVGEAFLTSSVVVANNTDYLDKPLSAQVIHREGITSFAHAPVTVDGTPIGVLSAFSRSAKGIFTAEFVDLYKNLAGQVGVAWRNALQTERLIAAREQEREMQIARSIQLGLLPTSTPQLEGLVLAGICVPAREVGGDYYDFLPRGGQALDLVIADVSGHSIGAALTMGWVRTFIQDRARAGAIGSAARILADLNEFFYADLSRAELFLSMFYLSYDAAGKSLSYASAGHPPPILWRRASASFERLDAEGLLLGILPKVAFAEERKHLQPGDLLLLFTDGITEAEDEAGTFFGEERLCALLRECAHLAPQQVIDRLLEQVRSFTGRKNFLDDVTLVVVKVAED